MVDVARQLLDELMGRNRNADPQRPAKQGLFCVFQIFGFPVQSPHNTFFFLLFQYTGATRNSVCTSWLNSVRTTYLSTLE